jgi:hypothetical protein
MKITPQFPRTRPLTVTILVVFVLFITVWNVLRTYVAFTNWEVLYGYENNPAYVFASGLIWTTAGITLSLGLVRGKRLALPAGFVLSVLYLVWYWLDRLIIQASPAGNVEFSAIVSGIMFAIYNLLLYWPSSRVFFKETG